MHFNTSPEKDVLLSMVDVTAALPVNELGQYLPQYNVQTISETVSEFHKLIDGLLDAALADTSLKLAACAMGNFNLTLGFNSDHDQEEGNYAIVHRQFSSLLRPSLYPAQHDDESNLITGINLVSREQYDRRNLKICGWEGLWASFITTNQPANHSDEYKDLGTLVESPTNIRTFNIGLSVLRAIDPASLQDIEV